MPDSRGLTLLELMLIVMVTAVLAGILLPQWIRQQHRTGCYMSCANNQRQITLAFKTRALDNNNCYPMKVALTNGGTMELLGAGNVWPHFLVMSNELSTPYILFCPEEKDRWRSRANVFLPTTNGSYATPQVPLTNDSHISYFVSVDADETQPDAWLIGDHDLQITGRRPTHGLRSIWTNSCVRWSGAHHEGGGYVGFDSGSVQWLASTNLGCSLAKCGVATNRLNFP